MYSCSGTIKNWGWAKGSSVLSEIGTLHLEFQYLTYITGKQIYFKKVSSTCTCSTASKMYTRFCLYPVFVYLYLYMYMCIYTSIQYMSVTVNILVLLSV